MRPLRGLIALVFLAIWAPGVGTQERPPPPPLRVHFIDVDQGDAVLIQSPSGQNVLYDAGEHPTRVRDYLVGLGITSLALVVASHNHADHIGGSAEVVRHFRPPFYMDNGVPITTVTYARVQEAVATVGSQLLEPSARKITAGDASLTVVPPPGIADWDQNDNSIGVVVEYGEFRLSLAGDAEPREWAWWRTHASESLRPVHVHKASHHGSSNGDTTEGVALLTPKVVVIGVGAGNTYGHPDQTALQLYANAAAQVFRTDHHGTVIVEAQPSGVYTVHVERGEGAQPPPPPPPPPSPPPQSSCIDINRAGFVELQEIIHIGPDRAQQVIDLRRSQLFRSVDDLIRVDGIGPARLADIKAQGKACVR
jgi:competence protein ComEC